MRRTIWIPMLAIGAGFLCAQDPAPDPAYAALTKAYSALQAHDYDPAIDAFREAARLSPARADIHENLAYALLRAGDSAAARIAFGEAMRLDPGDFHTALEYAFLCFEASNGFEAGNDAPARKAEARRVFAFVRDHGDPASRATAAAAFRNIDEPLVAGIERWKKAIAAAGPSFSACDELAQLAEQRDDLDLAAANYEAAFRLTPARRSVLIDLARVEKARGDSDAMMAALIAASRGDEPRAAEMAREQLPARYPYVYEFRNAVELDPSNEALRRELAYLLLRMSQDAKASRAGAEKEFALLHDPVSKAQLGFLYLKDKRPDLAMPLLNDVLSHGDPDIANRVRMTLGLPRPLEQSAPADSRALGDRSYKAGFLKDALRYYTEAREANPLDAPLALKLGWTNNLLQDDVTALRWFDIARRSADPAVAAEAQHAWSNLRRGQARFQTTVWLYPLLSSRWNDLFGYGQVKTEVRIRRFPLHPYISLRLAGDVRRETSGVMSQSLSENALIAGAGVATDSWHRAIGWFEAGVAVSYLNGRRWKDYRGGVSWARTHGAALNGERPGWFLETAVDGVYSSHFANDSIFYGQARAGYTFWLPGVHAQIFGRQNLTLDARGQYWANFSETGPGFRLHPAWLPAPLWIGVEALRGSYLRGNGLTGESGFHDLRLGVWYAFTR